MGKCAFCKKKGFMFCGEGSLSFCDLYCENEYYRKKIKKAFEPEHLEETLDKIINAKR